MTRSKTTTAANDRRWIVHKFGGSSVADAECITRVAGIIEADPHARVAVVLSACKGVTDALLELVALAEAQDATYLREAGGAPGPPHRHRADAPAARFRREPLHRPARGRLRRHRRHPADREPDPLGGPQHPRPGRRLRRDLVDADVRARCSPSARSGAAGALDRRAQGGGRRVGAARTRRCSGPSRRRRPTRWCPPTSAARS